MCQEISGKYEYRKRNCFQCGKEFVKKTRHGRVLCKSCMSIYNKDLYRKKHSLDLLVKVYSKGGDDGCKRHPKCLTCPFPDCMVADNELL